VAKYNFSCITKKKSKLLSAFLINLGFCAVSLPVLADDLIYNGNFCTPVRADINKVEHGSNYGVHNVSNSTATVQCPFIHPITHSGVAVNKVWVTVYDRNPSTNVSCTLYGVGLEGSIVWQASKSSSGSGTTHQFLEISPQTQGVYSINMKCTIPAAYNGNLSHISTYWIRRP
jgi:hypothetical protein